MGVQVSPRVRIVDAGAEHVAAIVRLEEAVFPVHAFTRRQVDYYRRRPRAFVLVAVPDGGTAIGHLAGALDRRHHPPIVELLTLAVAREQRGRGVGRRLLQEALARAAVLDAAEVRLHVDVRSRAAMHLYREVGFVKRDLVPDYYGAGRPAWRLALPLVTWGGGR